MNEEDLKETIDKMDDPNNHWEVWVVIGCLVVLFTLDYFGIRVL